MTTDREAKKELEKTPEIKKKEEDELEILMAEGVKYQIEKRLFIQKPLVLIDLKRILKPFMAIFDAYKGSEEKLELAGIIEPSVFLKIGFASEEATENFFKIFAILLKEDTFNPNNNLSDEDKIKFIAQNVRIEIMSKIIADFFLLNNMEEIIQNFTMVAKRFPKLGEASK